MAKKSRSSARPPRQTADAGADGPAQLAARPNPTRADRIADRRDNRARGRQAVAQSRRRQKRIQTIMIGVVALVVVAALGVWGYQRVTHVEPGESAEDRGRTHIDSSVTATNYNTDPPTSGQHWGNTAPWGISDEPVPNELQVHNLEHGGVVMQYNSSVTPEEIAELESIASQCDVKLILAPRPEMEQRIALTAWTKYLNLETVDRAAIQDFIDAHVDEGPEQFASETERWEECQS